MVSLPSKQEYEPDSLDAQIITLLQGDGRLAYSLIARELEVPEATVRYRLKRLLDEEIIKIGAFLNTGKLKYENVAFIELNVNPDFYENILDDLVKMEQISYVASYTGPIDVVLEYIYQDNDDLFAFIKILKAKPEIRSLESRVILKIHKAQYPVQVKSYLSH